MKLQQFLYRVNGILEKIINTPFHRKDAMWAHENWFSSNATDANGELLGKLGRLFTTRDLYGHAYIPILAFVLREAGFKVFGDRRVAYVVWPYSDYDEVKNPNSTRCESIGWNFSYHSGITVWVFETRYQEKHYLKDGKLFIPWGGHEPIEIPPFSMTLEEVIENGRNLNTSPGPPF